jgi:hypothetical protein
MSEPLPIASISIQNDPHLTDVPLLSSPLLLLYSISKNHHRPSHVSVLWLTLLHTVSSLEMIRIRAHVFYVEPWKKPHAPHSKRFSSSRCGSFSLESNLKGSTQKAYQLRLCLLCAIKFSTPLTWLKLMIDWNMSLLLVPFCFEYWFKCLFQIHKSSDACVSRTYLEFCREWLIYTQLWIKYFYLSPIHLYGLNS